MNDSDVYGGKGMLGTSSAILENPTGPYVIPAQPPGQSETVSLSVILPTYNESKNVADAVRRLALALDDLLPSKYEIIVVDDNSPDGTSAVALSLVDAYPQLRVLTRTTERGLSSAVIRGWQAARGEFLAVIDADLQHPPETMTVLAKDMIRGADIAVGSRHIEGGGVVDWSMGRRIVSRVAQLIGLMVLPEVVSKVSDPMSGMFIIRRSAVCGVQLRPLGYKILIEVLARGRCQWISEQPYIFRERELGNSKADAKLYLQYLRHLAILRLDRMPFKRFTRFAIVGASGAVVDMTVLYLLSDPSTLAWGLTRSKLIASELAILNNFVWNDRWTFRDLSAKQKGFNSWLHRLGKFQLICLVGLGMNTLLLNLLFNWLHMNRYLANAIAIVAVTAWNFGVNLSMSWRTAAQPS